MKHRPNICLTAGGILVYRQQVLLVKHKKLNVWLAPGGHVDSGELPHETAEREFLEETGIRVKVVDPFVKLPDIRFKSKFKSQYLPSPILTNLHWVCEQNYQARVFGKGKPDPSWSRGCEQHLGFTYLVEVVDNGQLKLKFNQEETTDIGWFQLSELDGLDSLTDEIKWEVKLAFSLVK